MRAFSSTTGAAAPTVPQMHILFDNCNKNINWPALPGREVPDPQKQCPPQEEPILHTFCCADLNPPICRQVLSPEEVLPRRRNTSSGRNWRPLRGWLFTFYKMTPLSRAQFLCFLLVWLAYASTYLLRKPLGVIKADLGEELGVSANVTVCLYTYTYICIRQWGTIWRFLPEFDVVNESCICQAGKVQLGWCDTALVLPYAAIQIFWPGIADRSFFLNF